MSSGSQKDIWSARWRRWLSKPRLVFFFAAFLIAQAAVLIFLDSKPGMLDRTERVRGRDFLIFYIAGYIVHSGHADRLYDQEFVGTILQSLVTVSDLVPLYPYVYPPNTALLFAPLGALPYERAVLLWWIIQLLCFAAAGLLLYDHLRPSLEWNWIACLGFASFYPIWNTILNGQISALLVLVLVAGLRWRRQNKYFLAGLVLSLLALKPQFGVGLCVWFLLRREWPTLMGLGVGGLTQIAITALTLGFDAVLSYLHSFQVLGSWYKAYSFAPDHEHALAGVLVPFFSADFRYWTTIIQLLFDLLATLLLYRIIRTSLKGSDVDMAAGVVFMLFILPHFLTYDLTYLLIPVTALLVLARTEPRYLTPAVLLYFGAALAPLYALLGVSLLPVLLLIVLWLLQPDRSMAASPGLVRL
jgi:hypothetical protein